MARAICGDPGTPCSEIRIAWTRPLRINVITEHRRYALTVHSIHFNTIQLHTLRS